MNFNPSGYMEICLGDVLNGTGSASFSPDGKRLAIASDGKEAVQLFDTHRWAEVKEKTDIKQP